MSAGRSAPGFLKLFLCGCLYVAYISIHYEANYVHSYFITLLCHTHFFNHVHWLVLWYVCKSRHNIINYSIMRGITILVNKIEKFIGHLISNYFQCPTIKCITSIAIWEHNYCNYNIIILILILLQDKSSEKVSYSQSANPVNSLCCLLWNNSAHFTSYVSIDSTSE